VQRGEVFYLRAPRDVQGHEQRGGRYGVIVQTDQLAALSTVIVAPTSSSARPASFRPEITIGTEQTKVLVEQLGAVDPSRLGDSKGLLRHEELREVDRALAVVLGLA
jgi:mRNA interferase MazF